MSTRVPFDLVAMLCSMPTIFISWGTASPTAGNLSHQENS